MGGEHEIMVVSPMWLIRADVLGGPLEPFFPGPFAGLGKEHRCHKGVVTARFTDLVLKLLQDGNDGSLGFFLAQPGKHVLFHEIADRRVQLFRAGVQLLAVPLLQATCGGYPVGFRLHLVAVAKTPKFERKFLSDLFLFNFARPPDCKCVTTTSRAKNGWTALSTWRPRKEWPHGLPITVELAAEGMPGHATRG